MKYPRTYHCPTSENLQNDDRKIETMDTLWGRSVVITEKLDGENYSLHSDRVHARSEEGEFHPWQSTVKAMWGGIRHLIPDHIQICGENIYAKHSIYYDRLNAFYYVFNVIDKERNVFLSVDECLTWCERLGLEYVPILEHRLLLAPYEMPKKSAFGDEIEGYVIRVVEEFSVEDYDKFCCKAVRKNHVRTTEHWSKSWIPNRLRSESGRI